MNKSIVVVNNNLVGFACGYVAWRSLHESDADFHVLDENNFNILNLELDTNIDLFLLDFIYRKSITYSVSIKVNSITAIFDSTACQLDVIEHVNNISIIRNHRSVIRDCWDKFIGEEEDYPDVLRLIDAHITNTQTEESIHFAPA